MTGDVKHSSSILALEILLLIKSTFTDDTILKKAKVIMLAF